jgi:putative methionine-R-sulfoxide reductase with GAF domain
MQDVILWHLGEGVLETDARGRIVRMNPAARDLLQMPGVNLLEATLSTLWGENADKVTEALARVTGPAAPEREVLELTHSQRHLRLTFTLASLKEGAAGFLVVIQDITALKRRIEELDALNHVATILNSAHDLHTVLELAIERIAAALHAEAGSLLVVDEATGELVFEVALGPVAHRLMGRRLAPGQGIAGWVAQTGKSLLVPDVSADPRFSGGLDKASGFVTRTLLCTPLQTGRGIIGVVQLLNRIDGGPFSQVDLQLLETIAFHAAAIIEHARGLERERVFGVHLVMSNFGEEFSGTLESLQGHLEDLFKAAAQHNPEMVTTIEEALECLEALRKISRHLSDALPENSNPRLPPTP